MLFKEGLSSFSKAAITVLFAMLWATACSNLNEYFDLEDDHFIEEMFEQQIENQTGLDVDLTPDTPEK